MFRLLFKLCAGFLLFVGRIFHFSYEKISVVFNLYLQGTILMLSGALPFFASVYAAIVEPTIFNLILMMVMLIYASIYYAGWYLMFKHYPPRWSESFLLCVNDLQKLCGIFHVSYVVINLIIFVVWWLTLLFVNVFLSYIIIKG